MHTEIERTLLITAPFYLNQIEIIKNIAKSIPINYKLYVKEHPLQGPERNWRDTSFYKKIFSIPNVKLFHPSTSSELFMKNCELVVSVGGTSCFEAGFFGKHAIMFADLGYSAIPSVKKLNSYDELHDTINQCIMSTVEPNFVKKYVNSLNESELELIKRDIEKKLAPGQQKSNNF